MPRRSSSRSAAALVLVPASEPYGADPPSDDPFAQDALPLHDHSCPLREVAVLSEVDSGYRWNEG
jgi:hypothetical protein